MISLFDAINLVTDRVLDWMIGFIASYTFTTIQLYRYSTNLHFTVTHALGFSVFTSRILSTDL
jgi:hypothetical protein